MSAQQPMTDAEAEALRTLGHIALADPSVVLEAYRAGFADGRKQWEPRVFREGDPDPGPEVVAVIDCDRDVWQRQHNGHCDWGLPPDGSTPWVGLVAQFGPLVSCPPPPDYEAVIEADTQRRAGGIG